MLKLEDQLKIDFEKITRGDSVAHLSDGGTRGRGCTVEWTLDAPSVAVKFDEHCIRCVEESAAELFGDQAQALTRRTTSGAGVYPLSFAKPRSLETNRFDECDRT